MLLLIRVASLVIPIPVSLVGHESGQAALREFFLKLRAHQRLFIDILDLIARAVFDFFADAAESSWRMDREVDLTRSRFKMQSRLAV